MYSIYADNKCIYNDTFVLKSTTLINPKLKMEDNSAGSLSMTLPCFNAGYESIVRLITDISVKKDGEEIWSGRVLSESKDFWNNRILVCEGELAFFNDSTQPQAEYHDISVRNFLETLVNIHNSKVTQNRRFTVGNVTVTDPNDSLYRYTNYENTMECINEKLIKRLGGHLRIRKQNGIRYLDYLADFPNTNSQIIEFGKNLLDFTKNWDMSEFATVILPLGNRLEDSSIEALEAYLTVESVNNGSKYVTSSSVNRYGWIEKVVHWDEVSTPRALLRKARQYLEDIQFDDMSIELSAVDLHYLNFNNESIKLLDRIRAVSKPHGMDRYFPVTKLEIPLDHPEDTKYTLGDNIRTNLTSVNNSVNSAIIEKIDNLPKASSILSQANENAASILNMATNGYITTTRDQNGSNELYISDVRDYQNAERFWKWNMNGLGYSGDRGNTYKVAITMNGEIVADFITAGTLNANIIKTGKLSDRNSNVIFDLQEGTLTFKKGSINIGDGKFKVNNYGYLYAEYGMIGGFRIGTDSLYNNAFTLLQTGLKFRRDDHTIGIFGTSSIINNNDQRGLVMELEPDGNYMTWAVKKNGDSEFYSMKLTYVNHRTQGFNNEDRLYLGCSLDGNNNKVFNLWLDPDNCGAVGGISGRMNFVLRDGGFCELTFKNGMLVKATSGNSNLGSSLRSTVVLSSEQFNNIMYGVS